MCLKKPSNNASGQDSTHERGSALVTVAGTPAKTPGQPALTWAASTTAENNTLPHLTGVRGFGEGVNRPALC